MRHSIHSLALAGLAWAALAAPAAVSAMEREAPAVRLVAPRAGATLAAGSAVELEWTAAGKLEGVEEWEAFLSLDGGKTYPLRITPHLDQDLRRVRWQVPAIPTSNARLLLRFGDESEDEEEASVELPQRFSIVSSPVKETGSFELASVAPERGERALPGQDGVVAWVEGSRRGGRMRQVVAAKRPGFQAQLSLPKTHDETAVLATGQAPLPVPRPVRGGAAEIPSPDRGPPLARPDEAPLPPSDILLLIQRQNE